MFLSLVSYDAESDQPDTEVGYTTLWSDSSLGVALISTEETISKIANGVVHSCIEATS